ncbi:fad NAD binding oxidoreductase [Fusarium sp. NRRL 52700]|nr:fad NAD binding oxidoreductase [Fusarium sp. NRRL 52700]
MREYPPGANITLLDANENAFGPSIAFSTSGPKSNGSNGDSAALNSTGVSKAAVIEQPTDPQGLQLHRYPDAHSMQLRQKFCNFREVEGAKPLTVQNVCLTVGGDESIDIIIRVFCTPSKDKILISPPTYGMYEVSAHVNDVGIVKVNLDVDNGFALRPDAINEALSADSTIKVVFICSPGNPAGNLLERSDIVKVLEHPTWNGIVVVDEAYIDFAPEGSSSVTDVNSWPNLIVAHQRLQRKGSQFECKCLQIINLVISSSSVTQLDPQDQITILEASSIASAASGKVGGLIALWAYPSCIVPLSFQLHADLAAHHNGAEKWGYRRIHSARLGARGRTRSGLAPGTDAGARGNMVIPTEPADLDWLHVENVHSYRSTGTPENTAQVIPYEFTTAMAELAIEKGASVVLGRATSIDTVSGAVKSVTYVPKGDSTSVSVPATDVVLCAGPWTRSLLPAAPIVGLRQHSVIMRPTRPRPLSGYMLFSEISLATSGVRRAKHVTAEIFTRPNNTVWAAGDTDNIASFNIPETAEAVLPDKEMCDNILAHVGAISDELGTSEVLSRQACYLPNVEGDVPGPILGSTSVKGLWIASGHSCWGIQNGPGTGKIMAEFVYDGRAVSADVDALDIRHLEGGSQN